MSDVLEIYEGQCPFSKKWYQGYPTIVTSKFTGVDEGIYFRNKAGCLFAYRVDPDTLRKIDKND